MQIGYLKAEIDVFWKRREVFGTQKDHSKLFPLFFLFSDTSYTMSVKLGDVLSPDTNLYVQLLGEKGETSKIMLRPIGSSMNKFEKGRTYKFTVETVNVGKVCIFFYQ